MFIIFSNFNSNIKFKKDQKDIFINIMNIMLFGHILIITKYINNEFLNLIILKTKFWKKNFILYFFLHVMSSQKKMKSFYIHLYTYLAVLYTLYNRHIIFN